MKNIFFSLLTFFVLASCKSDDKGIRNYDAGSDVVNIEDKIVHIDFKDCFVSSWAKPYIVNQYLVISDHKLVDNLISVFDKNTFEYKCSFGSQGNGPGEISNLVSLAVNEDKNAFYIIDYGKDGVFEYPIDSIFVNSKYVPQKAGIINKRQVPLSFEFLNDSVSYALFTQFNEIGDYKPVPARWNMKTGEISFMSYTGHPEIERKRTSLAISKEHNLYVEVYHHHDLITWCTLEGELKFTSYGSKWDNQTSNKMRYFENALFCGDRLVVSYLGNRRLIEDGKSIKSIYPDKLLVFDIDGNYIKTMSLNHPILGMCYDKQNNRLIFSFDDEFQFGYLNLHDVSQCLHDD